MFVVKIVLDPAIHPFLEKAMGTTDRQVVIMSAPALSESDGCRTVMLPHFPIHWEGSYPAMTVMYLYETYAEFDLFFGDGKPSEGFSLRWDCVELARA